MKVQILTHAPESDLAAALERFEREFTYPLGAGRSFSISHGQDYPRFFRAVGGDISASFVAMNKGLEVKGTLGVAVRPVKFPGGESRLAAYLGDLKTIPGAGRGLTLFRLTVEATAWSIAHGAVAAYGVVMEGTPHEPSHYTGRFGMHAFHAIERICILRIPVTASKQSDDAAFDAEPSSVEECFLTLSSDSFAPLGGAPELRSSHSPIPLRSPDHSACGIVEDTRLAKRLFREDGEEMLAAHLSKFAYRDPAAGRRLIREALARCANGALAPAMFVAIPESDLGGFHELLEEYPGAVKAPAAIYGTQFDGVTGKWNISTSEI